MKSLTRMSGLVAGALVVFMGTSAFAGELDVKVPFAFVVHGKTLPAGQYRVDTEGTMTLIHGEKGTHGAAVVLTMPAIGQDPAGKVPALTFARRENQMRLTGVWESTSEGQTVIGR